MTSEFNFPATQVLNYKSTVDNGQRTLTVTLMGEALPQDSLLTAMDGKLNYYHLYNTRLRIIQGNNIGSNELKLTSSAMLRDMYTVTQATINNQRHTIDSLAVALAKSTRIDTLALSLNPELPIIFPQVGSIAVTQSVGFNMTENRPDTVTAAIINFRSQISDADRQKLTEYLRARLSLPTLTIIENKSL